MYLQHNFEVLLAEEPLYRQYYQSEFSQMLYLILPKTPMT